jgi:hypothetical protein
MGGPNGMEGKEGFWNIHTNYNGARRSFGSHNHMHEKSTSMLQRKEQSLAEERAIFSEGYEPCGVFVFFKERTWIQDIISPHQTYHTCFVLCMVQILSQISCFA